MFAVSVNIMSKVLPEENFKCGKMDSYSGSELRLFISFRLGNEHTDQPSQPSTEEERMETNESFVTAPSIDEVSPEREKVAGTQEDRGLPSDRPEGSAEISPGPQAIVASDALSTRQNDDSDEILLQTRSGLANKGHQVGSSGSADTPPFAPNTLNADSSSTDESCSAYLAPKWEQLGDVPESKLLSQGTTEMEKSSLSVALDLTPGQGGLDDEQEDSDSVPAVTFLDSRKYPAKGIIKSSYGPPEPKIQKLCVKIGSENKVHSIPVLLTEGNSDNEGGTTSNEKFGTSEPEEPTVMGASKKTDRETDRESAGLTGSTVADALFAPERSTHFRVSDTASVTSVDFPEIPSRTAELSSGSRALISILKLRLPSDYPQDIQLSL